MWVRNLWAILLSVVLYALGLYGIWLFLDQRKLHWSLAAFPCAALLLAVLPFLGRRAQPVSGHHVLNLEEDRTE